MEARQPDRGSSGAISARAFAWMAGYALMSLSFVFSLDQQRATAFAELAVDPFANEPMEFVAERDVQLLSKQEPAREPTEAPSKQPPAPTPQDPDNPLPENTKATPDTAGISNNYSPSSHSFRAITPAQKMTLRREPQNQRFLGNDTENGLSIRSVQEELQRSAQSNAVGNMQMAFSSDAGWSADLPYGKYIYIHHAPLLFEDIPLERYGDECHPCLTPFVSFTKFMGTTLILPYKVTTDYWAANHSNACYAYDYQGNLRPGILDGTCFPSCDVIQQYPTANLAGLLAEFAVIGGFVAVLP